MLQRSILFDHCALFLLHCGFWCRRLSFLGVQVRLLPSRLAPLLIVLPGVIFSYVPFVFCLILENGVGLWSELLLAMCCNFCALLLLSMSLWLGILLLRGCILLFCLLMVGGMHYLLIPSLCLLLILSIILLLLICTLGGWAVPLLWWRLCPACGLLLLSLLDGRLWCILLWPFCLHLWGVFWVLVGCLLLLLCWLIVQKGVRFCKMLAMLCCLVKRPLCLIFLSSASSLLLIQSLRLLQNWLLTSLFVAFLPDVPICLILCLRLVALLWLCLFFWHCCLFCFMEWGPVVCDTQVSVSRVYFIQYHFSWLPRLWF